jgi:hypothetical protein
MKRKNLFMSLTLICGFFCFAFTFNNKEINWLWTENKPMGFILAILAIVFGSFWLKSSKKLKLEG